MFSVVVFFKEVGSGSVDELHSSLYFGLSPMVLVRVPLHCFHSIACKNCVSRQLTVDIEYGTGTFLIHVGAGFVKVGGVGGAVASYWTASLSRILTPSLPLFLLLLLLLLVITKTGGSGGRGGPSLKRLGGIGRGLEGSLM